MTERRPFKLQAPLLVLSLLSLAWAGAWARCADPPPVDRALQRLNAERAHGVLCSGPRSDAPGAAPAGPVQWNAGLAAVAAAQADQMVSVHGMGHRDMDDRGLGARLSAEGYRFSKAVENVAVGYATFDEVVDAWLASASHCANLMNGSMMELGLACSDASADTQDRYWALVLGAPRR